ncbi:hypothetical protein [Thermococcus zilligii]|uniref:hypothetical protein n=1 Tax=Thermococcus zilligii TaxID=54076 RepID=UPI00029B2881|nr:hypothetical protein [Thermococcus zilligii]
MRWKPLFAVLLGLLMVDITAGSAVAAPIPTQPAPEHNIGLGTVVFTWLKGDAVISEGRAWVPGVSPYVKTYQVKHNGRGSISVSVFKWVPLGGYFTAVIMPDMTTYNFYGERFKLNSISTHEVAGYRFKVLTAEYSSWFSFGGWWEQEVKFDAGYGTHGMLVIGYNSWPWLANFLAAIGVGKVASEAGKKLLQFIVEGSAEGLASVIGALLTGVSIDVALFTET